MLGTVKGLGERALYMAGVPLRWVGSQLEQGRVDAVRQRSAAQKRGRDRNDMSEIRRSMGMRER